MKYILIGITIVTLNAGCAFGDDINPNDVPNCISFGHPAVCHSDAVVEHAISLARRDGRCSGLSEQEIRDLTVGLDMTRGPYAWAPALKEDVCGIWGRR